MPERRERGKGGAEGGGQGRVHEERGRGQVKSETKGVKNQS
jgi:hypothetical protein